MEFEIASGGVGDRFENIIEEQEEKADAVFYSVKVDGELKIGTMARLVSYKQSTESMVFRVWALWCLRSSRDRLT